MREVIFSCTQTLTTAKMNKEIRTYTQQLTRAVKAGGKYSPAVVPLIQMAAVSLWQAQQLISDIAAASTVQDSIIERVSALTYREKTAYGYKIVLMPQVPQLDKTVNTLNRYFKTLGLTPSDVVTEETDDRLTEMTRGLTSLMAQSQGVIKPE